MFHMQSWDSLRNLALSCKIHDNPPHLTIDSLHQHLPPPSKKSAHRLNHSWYMPDNICASYWLQLQNSFLQKIHQTLCNTEDTIHNNHICTVQNRICAPKNFSHCLANLIKLRSFALRWEILPFHYLCKPHDFWQPTSKGMPIINKGLMLTSNTNPSRTTILTNPLLNALI